jgi:hypothetical protein
MVTFMAAKELPHRTAAVRMAAVGQNVPVDFDAVTYVPCSEKI